MSAFLESLLSSAAGFVSALGVAAGAVALWRVLRGEPVFRPTDRAQLLDAAVSILTFGAISIGVVALMSSGLGAAMQIVIAGGMIALVTWVMLQLHPIVEANKRRSAAAMSRENKSAQRVSADAPVLVARSGDNSTFAAAAPAAAALGVILVISLVAYTLLGLHTFWGHIGAIGVCLGVPLLILLGRYPGRITQSGTIEIAAPLDRVWQLGATLETDTPWHPQIIRIRRLAGVDERYEAQFRDLVDCMRCAWPKAPDHVAHSAELTIIEQTEQLSETVLVRPAMQPRPWYMRGLMAEMLTTRTFEAIPQGTRVTSRTSTVRPKLFVALGLMVGNVAQAALGELKAACEDTAPSSEMAALRARLQAIETSPKHCGCDGAATRAE
jgi:hypothetical protein